MKYIINQLRSNDLKCIKVLLKFIECYIKTRIMGI